MQTPTLGGERVWTKEGSGGWIERGWQTGAAGERSRVEAVEAIVRSMRTGEHAAAVRMSALLSPDVELSSMIGGARRRDDVVHRLSGQWAFTPVFARGVWTRPSSRDDDAIVVEGTFPLLGAAPRRLSMSVAFDASGLVSRIDQVWEMPESAEEVHELPDHVASSLDRALASGTPIVLSYVNAATPQLSLRGSVQVSGAMELSLWVRNASGGLVDGIAINQAVSLLYRDSPTRTTYTIVGRARLSADEGVRAAVYTRSPEVEQLHDPERRGAAVLIDIDRVHGTSPLGAVLVTRAS
jgi:hypothetical protein